MRTDRTAGIPLALAFTLVAATLSPVALAQETAARPSRGELEGMIEAYIITKLQEALDLTDEQFGRMVVVQTKLQETRREYRRERVEILRELRSALRRESSGEEELAPLLERLAASTKAFQEEERERYRDIDAILDVRQRARYRILETEVQRRLQQLMRRGRDRNRESERERERGLPPP